MSQDLILRIGAKLILPFILLFALYVQFHGDYSPGGGFQAGVIAASMVFLVAIVFGLKAAQRIAPKALVYAGTGIGGLLTGHNYLDYAYLAADPPIARERGILLVEIGVLITVSGTMTALFYAFVERGR
jgi:multicomponent Na+:H+ antiporter subunit B